MINFSSYHIMHFVQNNHWYYIAYSSPNFVDDFISHDNHTYIIQPPTGSIIDTISKILRKKCV